MVRRWSATGQTPPTSSGRCCTSGAARNELPLSPAGPGDASAEPSDDFAAYEQDRDEVVDYRQRMLMNVIALVIVTLLLGAGVWIADTIADLQRDQDCVMQGRVNCAPIELPIPKQQ